MFSLIFVADTKIIIGYNFVAPLINVSIGILKIIATAHNSRYLLV